MPSLSESFPTLGLLISGTRRLFSKPKKQQPKDDLADFPEDLFPGESVAPQLEDPADLAQIAYQAGAEERPSFLPGSGLPESGDSPLEANSSPVLESPQDSFPMSEVLGQGSSSAPMSEVLGQGYPSTLEESDAIPGLYETRVELEERVKRAQNELQAILATREEAAI